MTTSQNRKGWIGVWLAVAAVVLVSAGGLTWRLLFRQEETRFDDPVEHFKYGCMGVEEDNGIPYWLWVVLPKVFPQHLPGEGGYASLGMIFEEGHQTPIGMCRKTIGFPRVGANCGLCHTAAVRDQNGARRIIPGAPAHQLDPQAYLRFLFACASDPRFNADVLLEAIGRETDLSFPEKVLYRLVLIPATRRALLEQKAGAAWMEGMAPDGPRSRWGPGRVDPFNPPKFGMLGLPVDGTIGTADIPPLWEMPDELDTPYHWDGLSTSLTEVIHSSALGDGATPDALNVAGLERVKEWMMSLPAPPYPYPVDRALAEEGRHIYQARCAECHEKGGRRYRTIIPLSEPQHATDGHRRAMWTPEARDAYNGYARGKDWNFKRFQTTDGYVAGRLNGLWLRAPYLHNGSVPSLEALLAPPSERPVQFRRGTQSYDPIRVGFVSEGEEAKSAFLLDTRLPGNGNGGHLYGTALPAAEKRALLEYLKTL
ncbi:MAG TPA: cytochrome c [Myxococcales bacterium]|nr:cytochrome c [Myxococcales bacterium]